MKKLSAIFLAFVLVFSNVSVVSFLDDVNTNVEAKSYKSGKRGFSGNSGSINRIQKEDPTTNKSTTDQHNNSTTTNKNNQSTTNKNGNAVNTSTKKGGFFSGGFMRGLFVGGLAGLLFGSLFADMGALGNLLGFAINLAAILFIAYLIMKIYYMIKRKNEKEVRDHWRN